MAWNASYIGSIVDSTAPSPSNTRKHRSLAVGNKLVCPDCEELGTPGYHFKPLDRNEAYANELHIVYQHRKDRGGCGHIFSPGDQWVIAAFLAGDLVPREQQERARALVAELLQSSDNQDDNSERRTTAA